MKPRSSNTPRCISNSRGSVCPSAGPTFAVLPREEQDIVRAKVMRTIEREPLLVDKDPVQFPYVTELHVFRKQS